MWFLYGFLMICIIGVPIFLIDLFEYRFKFIEKNKILLQTAWWILSIIICYFVLMPYFGIRLLPSAFQY